MKIPKFLVGLLIGGFLGIIFWYYQKSTSAEDGALSVLDRLAASDARVRELEARLRLAAKDSPAPSKVVDSIDKIVPAPLAAQLQADDLMAITGIGPVYARRLQDGGVLTFADLAQRTPEQLMEICGVLPLYRAEDWISQAQERLGG
ncbi:MAG: helix-hairpin-helix domain-containing protein [Candidatus Promineifilaceae bacterium]|jgi:predicted flap endonuclease-1-like 5' DNA nuclease